MSSEDLSTALVEAYREGLRRSLEESDTDLHRTGRGYAFFVALESVLGPTEFLERFNEFAERLDTVRKEEYKAAGIGVMKKGVSRG